MINKVFLGIGIALLVFIPIWIFLVVPEMEKLPKDYSITYNLLSSENSRYEIDSDWIGESLLRGIININTNNIDDENLILNGIFRVEYLNGKLSYETLENHIVNRKNGKTNDESFFLFPIKLEKQSYTIKFPGWSFPLTMNFENEEEINGLKVYKFESLIESADLTNSFEFLDLVPNQYFVSTDAEGFYWVEPESGVIVKFEESGINYYVDKLTRENVQSFSVYSNKFNEDTIANQVRIAQNEKQRIILIEWIVPILLALIGLAFFSAYFISKKHIFTNENTDNTEKKVETKKSSIKTKKPLVTLNENNKEEEK